MEFKFLLTSPERYLLIVLPVFAISLLGTWCARAGAIRFGWMANPRPDRWHSEPRATAGGLGIAVALVSGLLLFTSWEREVVSVAVLSLAMFAVGLIDDFISIKPQTKLIGQLVAALILFFLGFHFNPALPYLLDLGLVLLWVVGITNAMNLLDNMDGLSAGIAIIAGSFRFLFYYSDGNIQGAILSAIFVGAVAGFLVFNFSPASVFMGNCGSFLIGFFLASLNLTTTQTYAKGLVSILFFPVLMLAIPIFDTTFVSLVRWFSGKRASHGGPDHPSHRLVAVGLSERKAVLILYGISIVSGTIAYVLYRIGFSYGILGVALSVVGLVLFGIYLSSVAVYPAEKVPEEVIKRSEFFTLMAEFKYKRRVLWVLVDSLTIFLAYYTGYLVRFGGSAEWGGQFLLFAQSSPLIAACLLLSLFGKGLYRSEWKHFSLHEIRMILTGTTIGLTASILALTYLFRFQGYSRAVFLIAWGASIMMLSGSRFFVRMLSELLRARQDGGIRVLIYGAGAGGELTLNEMRLNPGRGQLPVGFLDDDVFKQRTTIHGVSVLGGLDSLEFLTAKHRIDAVVVSTQKLRPERQEQLAELTARLGLTCYCVTINMVPMALQARV